MFCFRGVGALFLWSHTGCWVITMRLKMPCNAAYSQQPSITFRNSRRKGLFGVGWSGFLSMKPCLFATRGNGLAFEVFAILRELCIQHAYHGAAEFVSTFAKRRLVDLIADSELGIVGQHRSLFGPLDLRLSINERQIANALIEPACLSGTRILGRSLRAKGCCLWREPQR